MRLMLYSLIGITNALNNPQYATKLARDNYKLVPFFGSKWVKKYRLNNEEKKELFQEGYIGFMKACNKYDESYKVKLSTYSYYWIRKYMDDYVKKNNKNKNTFLPINLNTIPDYDELYKIDYSVLTPYEACLIKDKYLKRMKMNELEQKYKRNRNTLRSYCNIAIAKLRKSEQI